MPDAVPTSLFSRAAAREKRTFDPAGEGGKKAARTTLDFASSSTSNPKYFIETLKYFMDEDLKLGFCTDESQLRMEIEAKFCMHQHE